MNYDALEPEYLRQLNASVLLHSMVQYETALRVIMERPTPRTAALAEHLEHCLQALRAEMDRRRAAHPASEIQPVRVE